PMLPAASSNRSKNSRSLGTKTWDRRLTCEGDVKDTAGRWPSARLRPLVSSGHEVVRAAVGALEARAEARELVRVDRVGVVVLREAAGADVLGEVPDAVRHRVEEVGVALDEARAVALADAQQVVEHQHLAVRGGT